MYALIEYFIHNHEEEEKEEDYNVIETNKSFDELYLKLNNILNIIINNKNMDKMTEYNEYYFIKNCNSIDDCKFIENISHSIYKYKILRLSFLEYYNNIDDNYCISNLYVIVLL
uniref:Uncharacterized protein n=1 Tax=viral metagenome TaxID=1070528 RepID=A0A6C0H5W4_9ZZZZ